MTRTSSSGFIALMSAIIISFVLLTVATTAGLTGYFERTNILDSELKDRSVSAADACADQAFLILANDPSYTGLSVLTLNALDACRVQIGGGAPNIKIQATSSKAVTNLYINYNTSTHAVAKWQEVPTF